jgi:putative IMPACT (imprinted ancient) family translation regulator
MAVPYALFEQVRLLVDDYGGQILDEDFAVDVTMTVRFAADRFPGFQQAVRNLSAGKIEALVMETNPSTIMPLTEKGS